MHSNNLETLLRIPLTNVSPESAFELLAKRVEQGQPSHVHFLNAYTISEASKGRALQAVLKDSKSVNFCDSFWLAKATKSLNRGVLVHQMRGPSFFENIFASPYFSKKKHYLLGASDSTRLILKSKLEAVHNGISIVGSYSPPFREMTTTENALLREELIRLKPDVIWVGLGTPKQDFMCFKLATEVGITAIGVGAAFDFFSGTKREAPAILQKVGLEWVFRLFTEPRRLASRYFFGNAKFLAILAKQKFAGK